MHVINGNTLIIRLMLVKLQTNVESNDEKTTDETRETDVAIIEKYE